MKTTATLILATLALNTNNNLVMVLCVIGMAVLIYKMIKDEQSRDN